MVDLRAVLYDGSYHVGDSNEMAFQIVGLMAFKEAARKAGPVILEPVMSIEVVTSGIRGRDSRRFEQTPWTDLRHGASC